MPDAAAKTALTNYTGDCTDTKFVPVSHLGFSGSQLWRVTAGTGVLRGPLCLKRWPASHPPPARLPWIHRVLQHARRAGIEFVPEPQVARNGQTTCEVDGSTWELMTWMPGEVEQQAVPSQPRLQAAFRALAKFHQATAQFEGSKTEPAPAFIERKNRWQELTAGAVANIARSVSTRRIPAVDDLAQQWLSKYAIFDSRELTNRFHAAAQSPLRLQPAIRDLWRDHVLFTGDEVTGFIDFGALRIDTPLTDLARLIGSLAKDDPALRTIALDAYSELHPLTTTDRERIDLLDRTGTLIAGWNWLDWLYVEHRQFPSLPAIRGRLHELLLRNPKR